MIDLFSEVTALFLPFKFKTMFNITRVQILFGRCYIMNNTILLYKLKCEMFCLKFVQFYFIKSLTWFDILLYNAVYNAVYAVLLLKCPNTFWGHCIYYFCASSLLAFDHIKGCNSDFFPHSDQRLPLIICSDLWPLMQLSVVWFQHWTFSLTLQVSGPYVTPLFIKPTPGYSEICFEGLKMIHLSFLEGSGSQGLPGWQDLGCVHTLFGFSWFF